MEQNTLYVDGKPVGTVTGFNAEGDFTALERLAIECRDAEPQGATTCRRPYQALSAASAMLAGTPFGAMWARAVAEQDRREKILGKEATSVIIDEFGPTQQFGRGYRYREGVGAFIESLQLGEGKFPGMLWSMWRTRNLSHLPVAGARKRKAALKHAARRHRTVVRYL